MRIAFPAGDGTLTPYTFELGYPLMTLVYDTLTWRDAGGTPQPWLARSVQTSPDGRTVTVRLRAARWQDGRPLTAADVAFTFRYVREHPHPRFTPQVAAIERVDEVDRATVAFRLRHPSLAFADQPLADVPILPRHLWRGAAPPRGLPVGSGPYRLVSYRPGRGYRFRANGSYFRGRPLVRTLDVRIVPRYARAVRLLVRGRLDMLPAAGPGAARAPAIAGGAAYLGTALVLNVRRAPFDRPAVRRAVAEALDLRRVAGAAGDAVPAERGFLHPASRWASSAPVRPPAPAAARAVLGDVRPGPVAILAARGDPARRAAARAVAGQLRAVGLRARVRAVAAGRLAAALGERGGATGFDAAVWSTPALVSYDPDFLRSLFDGGRLDDSGYRSSRFDALAARTAAAGGEAERRRAIADELTLLARDAPVVPLYFANGAFPYRPSAYDRWVYVKGTGILDKQSFLPHPRARPGAAAPGSGGSGGGLGALGVAAIVLAAAALLAAAVVLARRA